ncbi:hypothetical protein AGMMS49975_22030 [Clostridia bacterium]|nr:hypothetical protein AGMMS49975_22030 [Clostridia bacterium]
MSNERLYYKELLARLDGLGVYRNILKDPVLDSLYNIALLYNGNEMSEHNVQDMYNKFLVSLISFAEKNGISGNIFKRYLISLFLSDENVFSLACERVKKIDTLKGTTLYSLALADIAILHYLIKFDIKRISKDTGSRENIMEYKPTEPRGGEDDSIQSIAEATDDDEIMSVLLWHYENVGVGVIGKNRMLRYDGKKLVGAVNYDKIKFSQLIGYEEQKKMLRNNTEAFLGNYPANNLLLVGARGTGKSSCVKALANEYHGKGLRVVEINKSQLGDLPELMRLLKDRRKKFILFIDDLSFEAAETEFKYMKSLLEGGVEARPDNVLFVATSNRRHIISEKWSDKDGAVLGDDLHNTDTTNEKLSLGDRFGITVTFTKPTKEQYLEIVLAIAKECKLQVPEDSLKAEALRWELQQKGFSGRTARQFINSIMWELSK